MSNSPLLDTPNYPILGENDANSSSLMADKLPVINDIDDLSAKLMIFSQSNHRAQPSITSLQSISAREFDAKDYLTSSTAHQRVRDLEFEKEGLGLVN